MFLDRSRTVKVLTSLTLVWLRTFACEAAISEKGVTPRGWLNRSSRLVQVEQRLCGDGIALLRNLSFLAWAQCRFGGAFICWVRAGGLKDVIAKRGWRDGVCQCVGESARLVRFINGAGSFECPINGEGRRGLTIRGESQAINRCGCIC